MSNNGRRFNREYGHRRYRALFVIAVEGMKTEPQYFDILRTKSEPSICLDCLPSNHKSAPQQVLNRMRKYIAQNKLLDQDQAWLVIDKDSNSDNRLMQLCKWSKQKSNYGFALSNPCFEYWLLLHFEDGNQIKSKKDCINRLKRHLPGYDKGIKADKFTLDKIKEAICRAQKRDHPPCTNWPDTCGGTTVYQLVEKMIKTET